MAGPSFASTGTPSSASSDLSSMGRLSSAKKAPKQRKGGLSMFLAGEASRPAYTCDF